MLPAHATDLLSGPDRERRRPGAVALLSIWLVLGAAVWAFVPVPGAALSAIPPELEQVHDTASPSVTHASGANVIERVAVALRPDALDGGLEPPTQAAAVLFGLGLVTVVALGTGRRDDDPNVAAAVRRRGPPAAVPSSRPR